MLTSRSLSSVTITPSGVRQRAVCNSSPPRMTSVLVYSSSSGLSTPSG